MRLTLCMMVGLSLVASVGCESSTSRGGAARQLAPPSPPEPAGPAGSAPAEAQAAAEPGEPGAAEPDPAAADPAQQPAPPAAGAPPAAPAEPPAADGEQKKAEVGVGVKGRDYGGPGFVTTPVMTKFRTEERIAFEVQIPNAMKIYKAGHDNKGPKTHDEFMSVIIKENAVQLPELSPGESYLYIPETEELVVKVPKPK